MGECERRGELVTANKPTVVAEPLFYAIIVEDSKSDGRLSDSTDTDQGSRREALRGADNLLDYPVTSKEYSWWWGR